MLPADSPEPEDQTAIRRYAAGPECPDHTIPMLDAYGAVKHLHQVCVVLSLSGFVLRFILMCRRPSMLERPWLRIAPHVNDTVLLGAALGLMVLSGQFPFLESWLTAKVFGLIAYIILGTIALKRAPDLRSRAAAGGAAVVVFAYVASVAVVKDARGFLAWFV